MIDIISLILIILCICCCMISIGAIIVSRVGKKNRNITVDYFLYVSLSLSCCCILFAIVPPIFLGYSFLNFIGFTPTL